MKRNEKKYRKSAILKKNAVERKDEQLLPIHEKSAKKVIIQKKTANKIKDVLLLRV